VIADLVVAAGMYQPSGSAYAADELKSWWQKNWPRTYTQLEQKQATVEPGGAAYPQDFEWFKAWFEWQLSRTAESSSKRRPMR
jgi:hypothetical protein